MLTTFLWKNFAFFHRIKSNKYFLIFAKGMFKFKFLFFVNYYAAFFPLSIFLKTAADMSRLRNFCVYVTER